MPTSDRELRQLALRNLIGVSVVWMSQIPRAELYRGLSHAEEVEMNCAATYKMADDSPQGLFYALAAKRREILSQRLPEIAESEWGTAA